MTPTEIQKLCQPINQIYQQLTDELMINVARNLGTYGGITSIGDWQIKKLSQMGQLTKQNISIIAKYTAICPQLHEIALTDAAMKAVSDIEPGLIEAAKRGIIKGSSSPPVSGNILNALGTLQQQAKDTFNLVNTVMTYKARDAYTGIVNKTVDIVNREEYTQILGKNTASVATGIQSRTAALRQCLKEFSEKGLPGFVDRSGREWAPEAYINMDIRTTVNNVANTSQFNRMDEYGCDLISVSSHAGARPLCEKDQGKIYSRSGKSGVVEDLHGNKINFYPWGSTSYGQPAGLLGINCGHQVYPFFPGLSVMRYEPTKDKAENDRIYQESQKQRYLERQVRVYKRQCAMLDAVGDQEGFNNAAVKLKQKEANLENFCQSTGRTPRNDRVQVLGFGRSQANKAVRANKTELEKYAKIHYHKDGTIVVTDDWTHKSHAHLDSVYKPNAVIDTLSQNGKQRDRMIYDENGRQKVQISNGPHANLRQHPYGKNGEHAHDIIWEDDKIIDRPIRELTNLERKENADIL